MTRIEHHCSECGAPIDDSLGYCPTHGYATITSTFNTDWVPLAKQHFEALGDLLRRNGHPCDSPAYLALKAAECALGFVPRAGLPGYFLDAIVDAIKAIDGAAGTEGVGHA